MKSKVKFYLYYIFKTDHNLVIYMHLETYLKHVEILAWEHLLKQSQL